MPYRRTGRPPGRPRHPGPVTPAEQRVLELLRQGLTNAEIAVRLAVSPETVKTHIASMLARLGLADRNELAAWSPPPEGRRHPLRSLVIALARLPRPLRALTPSLLALVLAALAGLLVLAVIGFAVYRSGQDGVRAPQTPHTPTAVRPVATGTPGCGERLTFSGQGPDAEHTLADVRRQVEWDFRAPAVLPSGLHLWAVSATIVRCRPRLSVVELEYLPDDPATSPASPGLRFVQRFRSSVKGGMIGQGEAEVRGYTRAGRGLWDYTIWRQPGAGGTATYRLEFAERAGDGVVTHLLLDITGDEEQAFRALRTVAETIEPGPPTPVPTGVVIDPLEEAPSWDPAPAWRCQEPPPDAEARSWLIQAARARGEVLSDDVVLSVGETEPTSGQYHAWLIDLVTGDYLHYDERGRRIESRLCDLEAIARLRAFADQPGFRDKVRALAAGR